MTAHYIDPYYYEVDMEALLKVPVAPREKVLERFDWQREAEELLWILRE